ncbi:MAG TPA: IS5/IS1182 family transposase, partial [Nitrospira sp.]|nr:IS5/IS1182 family transposase [Nitrospira sp.]
DAGWFITALKKQGVTPCIPPRKNQTAQCHKIETIFWRIKD